jgi:hypothetical protein
MMPSQMSRLVVYVAMLALVVSGVPLAAQSVPLSAFSRQVDVAGQAAIASFHFDHNAIEDAVLIDDELIALTQSGNLLRVSTAPLEVRERRILASRGTAITRDDGGQVLVGTQDGHVLAIDATSLTSSVVTQVRGRVVWLDRRAGRLVTVVEPHFRPMTPGENLDAWAKARNRATGRWAVVVADKTGVRTFPFPSSPHPSGFHIDRHGLLWIAGDNGEFGGGLTWIDLARGNVKTRELERGIVGFLEFDRLFEAFGGLDHLGSGSSFLVSVSPDYAITSWVASSFQPEPVPAHPAAPIVDMQADSNGRIWALSGGWLYRHDLSTSAWTRGPQVKGHRLIAAKDSPTLFVVSRGGGISRVNGNEVATLSFSGQLPADALGLWRTPSGLSVLTTPRYGLQTESAWRFIEGAWTPERLCPESYEDRTPYPGLVVQGGTPIASDASETFTVCAEPPLSRTERLLRSAHPGEWETIAEWKETSSRGLMSAPDGTWLRADTFQGILSRLVGNEWEAAGTAPEHTFNTFIRWSIPELVRIWRSVPDRALYHSTRTGELLELTRQPDSRWRLARVNQAAIASVWDATPDGDDALLVASPRGLFRYLPATRALTRISAPGTDGIVSITRDTLGRLWAVGNRVYTSTDEGRRWEVVDVPSDSSAAVALVRPYPGEPGAVAVMTSSRGVVVIEP